MGSELSTATNNATSTMSSETLQKLLDQQSKSGGELINTASNQTVSQLGSIITSSNNELKNTIGSSTSAITSELTNTITSQNEEIFFFLRRLFCSLARRWRSARLASTRAAVCLELQARMLRLSWSLHFLTLCFACCSTVSTLSSSD